MDVPLTDSELAFLQRLLKPYVDYYGTLASNGQCTKENRAKWELVRKLEEKLEP
jgi:hypothetical protein